MEYVNVGHEIGIGDEIWDGLCLINDELDEREMRDRYRGWLLK